MSQHARIEEVSDSDLSDPSEQDLSDFAPTLIRPSSIPIPTPHPTSPLPLRTPPILQPQFRAPSASENDRHKRYQCLYPLYFDVNRTRSQGRRVGHELAVSNPLAREIVEAVQLLGLDTVFEPGKVHPKDWSNPGRVRVLVKEGGRVRNRGVKNSMSVGISCGFSSPCHVSAFRLFLDYHTLGISFLPCLACRFAAHPEERSSPNHAIPRTSPLHPGRQTPPRPPNHPGIPSPSPHPRHASSGDADPRTRRAPWMENELDPTAALSRAERRRRERKHPPRHDGGNAGCWSSGRGNGIRGIKQRWREGDSGKWNGPGEAKEGERRGTEAIKVDMLNYHHTGIF